MPNFIYFFLFEVSSKILIFLGIAYGYISALDGVGSVLSSYIMMTAGAWSHLPSLIFLFLNVGSLVAAYFVVPETKNQPMRDALYEMDRDLSAHTRKISASPTQA